MRTMRGKALVTLGILSLMWALAVGSGLAYAQDRPMGEIVFIIDESGSMFNDLEEVKSQLVEIVSNLASRVDLRLGLVGFGAYAGHWGTEYHGQAHIHLPLKHDLEAFVKALDDLVTGGGLEPGFSAIALAMSDEMGFRPAAATCAILITDEDADIYEEAPTTKADALEALAARDATLLGIVGFEGFIDPSFEAKPADDYGPGPQGLAELTSGEVFNIIDFRSRPGPVLEALMERCVSKITQGPPSEEPPTQREEPETLPKELKERFQIIITTIAELRDQVEDTHLNLLNLKEEVTSLRTTLARLRREHSEFAAVIQLVHENKAQLVSIMGQIASLTTTLDLLRSQQSRFSALTELVHENRQRISQVQGEITAFSGRIASLSTTVADLTAEHRDLTARLESIAGRVDALDAKLGSRIEALTDEVGTLRQNQQQHQKEHEQLHTQMGVQMRGLTEDLSQLSASVSQLSGKLESLNALPQEIIKLQTSLAALDTALREKIKGLTVRIETDELAIAKLQEDIKSSRVVTEKFLENFGLLTGRLEKVESGFDHLQAALEDLQAQHASDTESLAARSTQLESLTASQQDKLAQLDTILERLAQLEAGLAELDVSQSARLDVVFQSLEELRLQMAQMDRGLAQLAERVEDDSLSMAEFRSQLSRLQEDLDAQRKRLLAEMEANRRAIEELRSSLAEAKEELKREVTAIAREVAREEAKVVEVREDPTTKRLAQLALAFSLAAIGVAWLLFMQAAG